MPQIRVPIVGNKHYPGSEETLKGLPVGAPISLVRERDNQHDPRAIACYEPGGDGLLSMKLGFIPSYMNADISAAMDAGRTAYATLVDPPQGREPARIIVSWEA